MSMIYYQKEPQCSNYSSDDHICFRYVEIEAGTRFGIDKKRDKHIFFFLEGSVKMRYNEFSDRVFGTDEMVFLPKSADCKAEALTRSVFIVLVYDNIIKLYDNATFTSVLQQAKGMIYEFKSLSMVSELRQFLDLLRQYLLDGIDSICLHAIKEQELFLLLGAYYEKEKLIQFFFPMIGKSMDFRSKVMANYMSVRSKKELANICSYSMSRFSELFLEEFGKPPYQWMQKQKSKHIIGRLADTDIPIKDIVAEFNFTGQSHFNKYCMKLFGDSPTRIRAKLLAGDQVFSTNEEQ